MNEQIMVDFMAMQLGANGLPYILPIHPNLVHLTLGLFIIGIAFDIAGLLFPLDGPILKSFGLAATRTNFFDVGWYNLLASAIITFFTVASGFFEIMLADPPPHLKSAWGLEPLPTMLLHGVIGVFLLAVIVAMTVWRGFLRYRWRKDSVNQVSWSYVLVGVVMMGILAVHGTLGAQMAAEFGIHITADNLLQQGKNLNALRKVL